ncbi:MAG: radical SAM protein [Nanoarchaeota archaeon]|nr:radical SAM protein [Nanoarchaeota archaeon]
MITGNPYYSYNLSELPLGCQYCVRGEKLVLFVTGLCPRRCYFCPVSDQKYGKDVTFANERPVEQQEDVLEEAEAMSAKGTGITGGDPFVKVERTAEYIKKLKKKYGKEFHAHLYTSLNLVTKEKLQLLAAAGLDEIRFHLDLDSETLWPKLEIARSFSWDIGVELPLLPNKEEAIKEAIAFMQDKADFLVLNELEVADTSQSQLLKMGYTTKHSLSYAVKGSVESGLRLLESVREKYPQFKVHLCTAKLKDAVQLTNRLKREAQGVKRPFDIVSKEGLLTRGALYLPELVPGFGYREKIALANKERLCLTLEQVKKAVQEKLQLQEKELFLDKKKPRLLLAAKLVRKHKKRLQTLGVIPAIVKEYPTADQLEIEVELFQA